MNKTEFTEKLTEIMSDDEKCEALAEELFAQIDSDSEPYRKIGRFLIKAYLDKSVDDALIAISGWSLQSLLERVRIIPDETGVYLGEDE